MSIQSLTFPHTGRPGPKHEQTYTGELPDNSAKIALFAHGEGLNNSMTVLVHHNPEAIQQAAARVWRRYCWRLKYQGKWVPVPGAGRATKDDISKPFVPMGVSERCPNGRKKRPAPRQQERKAANALHVVCLQTGVLYDSVAQAAIKNDLGLSAVFRVINGIKPATRGLSFRKATEEEQKAGKMIGELQPIETGARIHQSAIIYKEQFYESIHDLPKEAINGQSQFKIRKAANQHKNGFRQPTNDDLTNYIRTNAKHG